MYSSKTYKIVVLEENHVRRDFIRSSLADKGHTSFYFEKINICLDNLASLNPDLIILGSPREQHVYRFFHAVGLIGIAAPVLIITDLTMVEQFVDLNGFSQVVKIRSEFNASDVDLVAAGMQKSEGVYENIKNNPIIVGKSAEMVHIKRMIPSLNQSREKVLIVGEQGSGRELLARAIHCHNGRQNGSFIKIDTDRLPKLFDYHKTVGNAAKWLSDVSRRFDGIDDTDCWTFFIGDIDNVPEQQQPYLFYIMQIADLESGRSDSLNPIDIRIIASATSNLEKRVESGLFDKGLYYRLNVIHIDVPPLRHRSDDIPLMVDYFADRLCWRMKKSFLDISEDTKAVLSRQAWYGNARELRHVIDRIVSEGNEVDVLASFARKPQGRVSIGLNERVEDIYTLAELSDIKTYLTDLSYVSLKEICREYISRIEKKLMIKALNQANGNRKKAASMLDISYKSLLNKIKTYNLQ